MKPKPDQGKASPDLQQLLSIIVPVFNEVSSVLEVVNRLLELPMPRGMAAEIIVVDDGSTDGTSKLLTGYRDNPAVKVYHSERNCGKGVAVRAGLHYAQGDIIAIQDADLEYNPGHLMGLVAPIVEKRAKVVYGSRYLGLSEGMGWWQNLGNRILTQFTNLLFGCNLTDIYTCYKVMDRAVAQELSRELTCKGFELEAEITARLLLKGLVPLELPIDYTARSRTQGKKIRAQDGFFGLWYLLRLRLRGA